MKSKNTMILGLMLILFIFNILILTSIFFLFKINITPINTIIALIITALEYIILLKKEKNNLKKIITNITLFLTIILISIFISGLIYDTTYDSNTYHKVAIGELKNGWNPVYENIEEFNKSKKNKLELTNTYDIWTNHYAKGYWIYAANIYSLTKNIETGKSINIIITIASVLIFYQVLRLKYKKLFSFIISLLITFNPIAICQLGTFYNDGLLGNLLILMILSLSILLFNKEQEDKKYYYGLYFLTLVILINIKYTGFAYAGIYSLIYYIYLLLNKEKRKEHIKPITIIGITSLIIGLFLIGLSTYPKNIKTNKHPFYPLYGENKVDIMTGNTPTGLDEMNRFKRYFYANFSSTYNKYNNGEKLYKLKIPFTFKIKELIYYIGPDVRVGGYGVLFSGIIILTIILTIYNLIKDKKNKRKYAHYLIPILTTLLLIVIQKDTWWARYLPQIYLIPIISLLVYKNSNKNKKANQFVITLTTILLINSALVTGPAILNIINQKIILEKEFTTLKETDENIELIVVANEFSGAVYNIADIHKNITVKEKIENKDDYKENRYMGSRVDIFTYERK